MQVWVYGLKQAPRALNDKFTNFLPSIGFKFSYVDPSLFIKISGSTRVFLLLYVNDIIITGDCEDLIAELKTTYKLSFRWKILRIFIFLGLEIKYLHNGLFLSQCEYAINLVHKAVLDACINILLRVSLVWNFMQMVALLFLFFLDGDGGTPLSSSNITLFPSLVGFLQYPTFTRLDITYSVNVVCQFLHNPTNIHLQVVKRILRYVKGMHPWFWYCLQEGYFFP